MTDTRLFTLDEGTVYAQCTSDDTLTLLETIAFPGFRFEVVERTNFVQVKFLQDKRTMSVLNLHCTNGVIMGNLG